MILNMISKEWCAAFCPGTFLPPNFGGRQSVFQTSILSGKYFFCSADWQCSSNAFAVGKSSGNALPKNQKFPLLSQPWGHRDSKETLKKLNLWGKMVVDKSAFDKRQVCLYLN